MTGPSSREAQPHEGKAEGRLPGQAITVQGGRVKETGGEVQAEGPTAQEPGAWGRQDTGAGLGQFQGEEQGHRTGRRASRRRVAERGASGPPLAAPGLGGTLGD